MSSPAGHLFDYEEVTVLQRDNCPPNLSDSREAIRKRTFTRWINMHLKRCDPPMQVHDLLTDIRDGKILMALLEELSGCKMLYRFRPSTHYIFSLGNIAKALDFLEDRNVRVVNIDAANIADGRPSVVLELIWNIMVSFQLKEVTGNLEKRFSSMSSLGSLPDSSDSFTCSSSAPSSDEHSSTLLSKRDWVSSQPKYRSKAITALLIWANTSTSLYGVEVYDFSESWRDGLAFLALVKFARPELVDMRAAISASPRQNLIHAFNLAEQSLGIPALLQIEDMMVCSPDEQSVITYVAQFLRHFQDKDVELACPSLDDVELVQGCFAVGQRETSAFPQNLDVSSSCHCPSSSIVYKGIFPGVEKSIFSKGQILCCSPEVHCWSPLTETRSHSIGMEKDGESPSDESVLLALDSDEEDAYSYILELGHQESELHDYPGLQLTLCADINAPKAHHSLHVVSIPDFYKGEWHHLSPSLETQVQSLQPLSEDKQKPEKHTPETKLLYNNNIPTCNRNSELVIKPPAVIDLCHLTGNVGRNNNELPEVYTYKVNLHNSDRPSVTATDTALSEMARTLNKGYCPETKKNLHNKSSRDCMNPESLSPKKRVCSEKKREDDLSEVNIRIQSSLEDDDPELEYFTHQSKYILAVTERKMAATSNPAKDVRCSVLSDVISAETEILNKVLLLWILTYCIFILCQSEIWAQF